MTILTQFDSAANDSDKTFTVPAGRVWELILANILLVTTATVGNRQLDVVIKDESSNLILTLHAGLVQAASLTNEYLFMKGVVRETALVDGSLYGPIPDGLRLLPGWTIQFVDSAAIAAAADDMTVAFQYIESLARVEL